MLLSSHDVGSAASTLRARRSVHPGGSRRAHTHGAVAVALVLAGCGGLAVIDPPLDAGAGGNGGTSTPSSTTSTTTWTTTTTSSATGGTGNTGGTGGIGGPVGDSQLVETALGDVDVMNPTSFTVSSQTVGFTILVHSSSIWGTVGVEQLLAPSAEAVIQDYKIPGTVHEFVWLGTTPAAVPQSEAASAMPVVAPGTWQLTLGDPYGDDTAAKVSVWERRTEDGQFHGGLLDVNVFIAAEVIDQSYMQSMLQTAFAAYAGLGFGEVSFQALGPEWYSIDEQSFWDVLLETKTGSITPALNVIVVGEFTGELETAGGVSAGIPGQGIEHGTHASGVVMLAYGDPTMDGLVIRHEAGHLGGLMHTSEIEGGFHDPLSDTAECADPWNMLYECKDATNIMFPIALEPTGTFSPNQRRIIQGSTLYRGELVYATQSGGQQDPAPGGDKASEAARGRGHGGPAMTPPAGVRSLARGSWTTGLDPRVARVLASHWCGEPYWQAGRLPYPALLAKLGADPAGLLRVGADASAPAPIRARALKVAGRLAAEQAGARGRPGLSPPQVSRLVTLARGRAEPRPVRLAAMTALRAAAATAARALGPALRTDADPIVAHAAERPR